MKCPCDQLGDGAQLFRIRDPQRCFEQVADLGPATQDMIGGRWVWRCRSCGAHFALLRIPYKDEEDILVRALDPHWDRWEWRALADAADRCRWRGRHVDVERLL